MGFMRRTFGYDGEGSGIRSFPIGSQVEVDCPGALDVNRCFCQSTPLPRRVLVKRTESEGGGLHKEIAAFFGFSGPVGHELRAELAALVKVVGRYGSSALRPSNKQGSA